MYNIRDIGIVGYYLMEKYYSICKKTFCVRAPRFPADHENWRVFEVSGDNNDVTVECKILNEIPSPPKDCKRNWEGVAVWDEGNLSYRYTHMEVEPGVLSVINHSDIHNGEAFFTDYSIRFMMDSRYMWSSVAVSQRLLELKALIFHASYIEYDGGAILFTAPSGTGKSTQADLWHKYRGAEIINGDKAGVSVEDGVAYAHGVPFCGTSGICKNRSLPLKAIVLLSQAEENTLTRLTGGVAIQQLIPNVILDFIASGELQKCVDVLLDVIKTVPVFTLACTPDEAAVKALEEGLKNPHQ